MDGAVTSLPSSAPTSLPSSPKRLNVFERYLSLWVGLCMVVGAGLGLTAPGMMQGLRSLEFGVGSQITVPIAILIWLMRLFRVEYAITVPGALIGASNFFELAVSTAIALFGPESGAALATVVGVLIEVPVMLSVCSVCNRTRHWFPAPAGAH